MQKLSDKYPVEGTLIAAIINEMMVIRKSITLAICGVLGVVGSAFAQTWTLTSVPDQVIPAVASSADGSKLVAVGSGNMGGSIYTSTNSGMTWASNDVFTAFVWWNSVASSMDGNKLVVVGDSAIITSTNAGATWVTNSAPNEAWTSVACSADGNTFAAVAGVSASGGVGNISAICISTNGGMTWMITSAPSNYWVSVASSADGTKLVAAAMIGSSWHPDFIYLSTNSGSTWMRSGAPSNAWSSVASSADGSKLVAACFPSALIEGTLTSAGGIYTSTDAGATWRSNNVPEQGFQAVASSADGSRLVAGMNSGEIYTSTNSGATWQAENSFNASWNSFASSADGSKLIGAAMAFSSSIYISQVDPSPQLNLASSGNHLTASWVIPSTNFVMQRSSDFSSWTDVTNLPVLNLTNLEEEVVLSPTNSSGFYRLKTP